MYLDQVILLAVAGVMRLALHVFALMFARVLASLKIQNVAFSHGWHMVYPVIAGLYWRSMRLQWPANFEAVGLRCVTK
jgi:hypothetical protein